MSPTGALENALQRRLDDLPPSEVKAAPEAFAAVSKPRGRLKLKASAKRREEASNRTRKSLLRK